jgi:hypothetical protein
MRRKKRGVSRQMPKVPQQEPALEEERNRKVSFFSYPILTFQQQKRVCSKFFSIK